MFGNLKLALFYTLMQKTKNIEDQIYIFFKIGGLRLLHSTVHAKYVVHCASEISLFILVTWTLIPSYFSLYQIT